MFYLTMSLLSFSHAGWINSSFFFVTTALPNCPLLFVILIIRDGTWDKLQCTAAMPFCVLHELPISKEGRVMTVIPV